MIDRRYDLSRSSERAELLPLIERITDLMMAGDEDACLELIAANDEYATELRSVLPAMRVMQKVQIADVSGIGSETQTVLIDSNLSLQGRLGDFQIGREIGRGGMGVVYEAEQLSLKRRVAVKILPFASVLDTRQIERFKIEARASATLSHPNIVPIYFVGVDRGIHFYAMQYVEGQSLASVIEQLRNNTAEQNISSNKKQAETKPILQAELSTLRSNRPQDYFRTLAKLAFEVANGLQHAHEHGIIHRDIKPSNLLLDASGACLITDFGLARLDDGNVTMSGDIVGTLRYAPPEQVVGKHDELNQRADVYSLGATLFELLTLQPAMDAPNREALLQQVTQGRSRSLRSINGQIPRDLEIIVQKAMEPDAQDRYESAAAMADDLQRFCDNQPLLSQRPGILKKCSRAARRHPKSMLSAVALLAVLLVGSSTATLAINRARLETVRQRDESRANLRLAVTAVDDVYREIASDWITQDRNLSDVQIHFLIRSADTLTEIASRYPDEPEFLEDAGLAHLHAAKANARIQRFDLAEAGYQKARNYLARAIPEQSTSPNLRESLVTAHYYWAVMLSEKWQFDKAKEVLNEAVVQCRELLLLEERGERDPLTLVQVETEILRIEAVQGKHDVVVQQGTRLLSQARDLIDAEPRRTLPRQTQLQLARLVSESLRAQGKIDEAGQLCDNVMREAESQLQDKHDFRPIARAVAAVQTELARCQLALGKYESAEVNSRLAMKRYRDSFVFDGTPKEFSFAYMEGKATHDQMEPNAYAGYAAAQAVLAESCCSLHKNEDSLAQADEATRSCVALIGLFPNLPRYAAEAANCAIALLDVGAATKRLSESQIKLCGYIASELDKHRAGQELPQSLEDLKTELGQKLTEVSERSTAEPK
ncbi:MAG: serine/threonine protein kinase [Planctomycetales bacterium]|nr:serine/threonine protein kinase [Planctomycetales bacterium]